MYTKYDIIRFLSVDHYLDWKAKAHVDILTVLINENF